MSTVPDVPLVVSVGAAAAGAVLAVAQNVDTGLVVGAAGLLAFLFRYWFAANKRTGEGVWDIADEYRIERDYHRAEVEHWRARWLALVQPDTTVEVPPMPNFEAMKAEAMREKETTRGRRH